MTQQPQLLSVEYLTIRFKEAPSPTVRGVNFSVAEGETVALVGKSGSGKTLIASNLVRLSNHVELKGAILFEGKNVLKLKEAELQQLRRKKVAFIFQEPGMALNPALTMGFQLKETVEGPDKEQRINVLLKRVGFKDTTSVLKSYIHELSGGMQQRVMITMALLNRPKLLIADEPTTALDALLQQQVLDLLKELQKEFGFSVLLITHDLALLPKLADRVYVLKDGEIVEQGQPLQLLQSPQNAYTQLLVDSIFSLPKNV